MAKDLWLPWGFVLPDGTKIRALLQSGETWQIFDTDRANHLLLARHELAQKWEETGFLNASQLETLPFGNTSFRSLSSPKKYALTAVENSPPPENKTDALAFALALKASRQLSETASFHDAVYVEQYSRLLPLWTSTPQIDDAIVLGTWITGGVGISAASFKRLSSLTVRLSAGELAEIIEAAGLAIPAEAGLLNRHQSQTGTREKTDTARQANEQPAFPGKPPKTGVFTLPGRPQLETFFNEHVIDIILHAEKYQALGIGFPSPIVLHGPPGCGKTFAAERLVEFLGWPSYAIDSNSIGSAYIHETGKKIAETFNKAIEHAPSVIIIDEMESFLSDRRLGGASGLHHMEEMAEFLRRIPEAPKNNVLVIAMTNLIDVIDPAILRRGRFDHLIEVSMPSKEEVASLVDSLLGSLPKENSLSVEPVIDALAGKPLSDTAFVIREAARLAARAGKNALDQESLVTALNSLPEEKKENRRIGFV
ncbi:MAG: ATP-binding protein [Alistipes senegalensis]|nr:ATP-binding protein [Oxalobacter formigenes]MCM1281642.1 ATP-binding protein [Alistipes senegalensis]